MTKKTAMFRFRNGCTCTCKYENQIKARASLFACGAWLVNSMDIGPGAGFNQACLEYKHKCIILGEVLSFMKVDR